MERILELFSEDFYYCFLRLSSFIDMRYFYSMKSGKLNEKIIVIIGGTSGIGLSGAMACVEAGARVVTVGLDADMNEQARSALGDSALVLNSDATSPSTAETAIQQALDRFGGFSALYHVAGGSGRKWGDAPLHELTDEGWEKTLQLNLTSMMYSNRAAVRQFLRQNTPGVILNLSSVLGYSPSPRYFATLAYATSKGAIISFTQSAAAYYASKNIRMNVLAPALTRTPMSQRAMNNSEIMEYTRSKQPLDGGRVSEPSDLDAAVVYFLSDESRFVTGQVLAVDGGWTLSEGQYQT